MIRSSSEKDFQAKQEGNTNDVSMFSKEPSSSRQWSGFRNPRIVRVSRTFGGKDRHSKVRTIRGLRDRRIRLSVPTAIQLYDLQDRLGLSQPSKVIDWLLDASKLDIDKLPPLQMPPGNFGQFLQPMLFSHESNAPYHQSSVTPFFDESSKQGININSNVDGEDQDQTIMMGKSKYWDPNASLKGKSKEVGRELSMAAEKTKWMMKINEQENNQDGIGAQNLFPIANNHSSVQGLLNNATIPYNSYYHWEPSNLSLSQLGSHGLISSQTENDPHNGSSSSTHVSLQPSSFALSSHGSQFFFCPSTTPLPTSLFPPYAPPHMSSTTPVESIVDPRQQISHFQLLSSSSQHNNILPNSLIPSFHSISSMMKPFPSNVNPKLFPFQSNSEHQANKDDTGS